MKIKRSTVLRCPPEKAWQAVLQTKLLLYVAWPLIRFQPLQPKELPREWSAGKYQVRMYLLGIIPLGKQWIVISMNPQQKVLRDNGYGRVIYTWDHLITIGAAGVDKTCYTDEVTIRAGIGTPFITVFAFFFYGWRQQRWRKLVQSGFDY